MSNTIDSPNFLTFPVVFDPFSSYKNIDEKAMRSSFSPKKELHPKQNPENTQNNNVQMFTSMVCHQVKLEDQRIENAVNEKEDVCSRNEAVSMEEKHQLGKYRAVIQISRRTL